MWRVFEDAPKSKRKQHYYARSSLNGQYYESKCGQVIRTSWLIEGSTEPKCTHCERILNNETNKQR